MPCIILEGPDGAGKTELGKELLAGPCKGWEFIHNGTYQGMKGRDLFQLYTRQILKGRDGAVLLDRSFDSEAVYGPVMRGEDRLGKLGRKLLNRLCSAQGVLQVLCLPPKAVAEKNWRDKKVDYVDEAKKWSTIYERFAYLTSDKRYIRYDYCWNEGRTVQDIGRRFSTMIKLSEGTHYQLPQGFVGNPTAKYLIVGEQVNLRTYWVDLPFFDVKGVSAYLSEVLEEIGATEENLAFVNSLDCHDKPNPLPAKMVKVALGDQASRSLDHVPHKKIVHPSYALRFDQKRKFKRQLKEALGL